MTRLLEDIRRQPQELKNCLARFTGPQRAPLEAAAKALDHRPIIIAGIGSSWCAGLAMQSILQSRRRLAHLFDASELAHFAELPPDCALVLISRSGRSIEMVKVAEKARRSAARIIAITNDAKSPMALQADAVLDLGAPLDHLVSISLYSGLALLGGLLAAAACGTPAAELKEDLGEAIDAAGSRLEAWSRIIGDSGWLADSAPYYFLARGGSLASCHAARLLWEEVAKAPATAMPTGSFRHGPQEIIASDLRAALWIAGSEMRDEDLELAADLRRAGVQVLLAGCRLPPGAGEPTIQLPDIPPPWQFLIDLMPFQLAAELLAHRRGKDCDAFVWSKYIIESEGGL